MNKSTIRELLKPIAKKTIVIFKYFLLINPFPRNSCSAKTLRCGSDKLNKNYLYSRLGKNTPTCCSTHLYEILKDIVFCLDKNNIDYFVFYGTYLGAVRHKGFIPWDTDVDLCIMENDKTKAIDVLTSFLSDKYVIEAIDDHWIMVNYSDINKLHVDIYFMRKNNNYIYLQSYTQFQYPEESIFPLNTVLLYDLQVSVPNSLIPLHIRYGEKSLIEPTYQHSFIKNKKVKKFIPAKIDFKYIRK